MSVRDLDGKDREYKTALAVIPCSLIRVMLSEENLANYTVAGPFDVTVYQAKASRIVRAEEGKAFFSTHGGYAKRRGVYIFAVRAGRGATPVYVGKATKAFAQECFSPHKLGKCNEALADYAKGTLVIYFLCAPEAVGRPPQAEIGALEEFFIQHGVEVNPDLLNVRGTKQASWSVVGVVRARRGKPSQAAASLRKLFKISGPRA